MRLALLPTRTTFGRTLAVRDFGGFALSVGVHDPREEVPAHQHADDYQWCLTLEGGFEECSDGRTEHCGAGSLLIRPPDCVHADRFSRLRGLCLNLFPRADWLDLRGYAALADTYEHHRSRRLLALGRELAAELRDIDACSSLAAESLVEELFSSALRLGELQRSDYPRWFAAAVDEIEANPSSSLGTVAQAAGVSSGYLARAFRARFGVSVGAYARERRLAKAATLVRGSDRPLADIAAATGFYDQAHFSRAFKTRFGLAPAAYRATADR